MIVTTPDGHRWATLTEAATAVRVRVDLVRKWKHRGQVRSTTVGQQVWVCLDDVQDREVELRRRGGRVGRPRVGSEDVA